MNIQNTSNGEIFQKDFSKCSTFFIKCGAYYILADMPFLRRFLDASYSVLITYDVQESAISGNTIMFIRSID